MSVKNSCYFSKCFPLLPNNPNLFSLRKIIINGDMIWIKCFLKPFIELDISTVTVRISGSWVELLTVRGHSKMTSHKFGWFMTFPSLSRSYALGCMYFCHTKTNPLFAWRHWWMLPKGSFINYAILIWHKVTPPPPCPLGNTKITILLTICIMSYDSPSLSCSTQFINGRDVIYERP